MFCRSIDALWFDSVLTKMQVERELIQRKLLNPDLMKLIEKTSSLGDHKNAELSSKSRQAGNLLYVQKKHTHEIHETTLNFFSMSIAFAPAASEELALGYANRSALLLHLKRYEDSIEDIHKAFPITQNKVLKVKLLCRKIECLTALESPQTSALFTQAVEYFNKLDEKDVGDKNHLHSMLLKVKKELDLKNLLVESKVDEEPQQKVQEKINDFSSIDIKNSEKYGKHLIATRHVKPGEIVYVEKPHVVCPGSEKLYINCNHCLAIAWNGISCKHCNWCIYCSPKCKKEAWMNYHFVECSVITHMNESNRNYSQNFQMSLRAVIMGIRESGGIAKLKKKIESMDTDNNLQNLLSDKKCESNRFCSFFNLSSNIKDKHFEINIFNTALALSYAAKYTTLFGKNSPDTETCSSLADNEGVLFIGCLLLKFTQICNNYAYSLSTSLRVCKHANETVRCFKKYCKHKATYLAPISGLINNSCIPNVRRIFTKDQEIIVYALESIDKNSQIFESYLTSYYETPKLIDRKAILSSNFKFDCDCGACIKNWPSLVTVFNTPELQVTSSSPMSDLRLDFVGSQLEDEYREVMKQAANVDTKCDENTILELRKGIERASALLSHPSKARCTLLFSMRRIFDKMYGNDPKLFWCSSC